MNHDRVGQLYRPYLPGWLQVRISTESICSGSLYSCQAVVLYADLSGFTRLTTAFAALPDGAERLHDLLNHSYSVLIDTVSAHGGDVAAIAGDALTAWWPETLDPEVAQRCAAALQATMATLPAINTPDGPVRLDLRIGISAGLVYVALAGLPNYGVYPVFFGPAIIAATVAEQRAAPGTTHYAATAQPAPSSIAIAGDGPTLGWEHFLPPTFGARLRLNDLGAEYRRCVPAFCAFELPESPEEMHRFITQVQAVVVRWGGWLNEVEVGDKGAVLVLLFGAPIARGDDTSRAVGCCLELRTRNLIRRAGISVGTLFIGAVGSTQRRVYTAQGDDMNLAAHLMQLARPGTLLVSSHVRQELLGRYHTSPTWVISTKGHTEGVPVAEILSTPLSTAGSASLQRYTSNDATLIGRSAERRQIKAATTGAARGQRTLLLIEGESGIGKTALIQDLVQSWLKQGLSGFGSECSSGAQTTPLLAWRPILLDLCGIDESAPIEERRAAFSAAVRPLMPDATNKEALANLLGLTANGSPALNATDVGSLAAALIGARLRTNPVLIVIEDMQWADPATWNLAHQLLTLVDPAEPWPLCLVLAHRPLDGSTQAQLTTLHNHPDTRRIPLGPLDPGASSALCRHLLNVAFVDADLEQHIARQTAGQPLFIREYLRVLSHHELIAVSADTAYLKQRAPAVQVASSAQGIIQARVDRLDEPTRLTLKIAAVIGRSFPLQLLAAIHPTQPEATALQTQLEQLRAQQIIDLELSAPEPVYRFKNGITHEVAYNSLLFGQRRHFHANVARWYSATHAEAIAAQRAPLAVYDVLIIHLRHAEEWDATVQACQEATLCALRQNSTATALRALEQALALATNATTRSTLLLLRLAIYDQIGGLGNQSDSLSELADLVSHTNDLLQELYTQIFHLRYLLTIGEFSTVITASRRLNRQLAMAAGSTALNRSQVALLRAGLIDTRGAARVGQGRIRQATRLHQRALELCWRIFTEPPQLTFPGLFDIHVITMRCLDHLGMIALQQGNLDQAGDYHRRALVIAQERRNWYAEARARQGLAAVHLAHHATNDAQIQAMIGLNTSQAIADRAGQALGLRQLAAISAAQNDYAEAQRQAWHALAICTTIQARALERELLHDLAAYATAQGAPDTVATVHRAIKPNQEA